MGYQEFIESLEKDSCPGGMDPVLQALWYDAKGNWDRAHDIVQNMGGVQAARIHAYLHRKEGDLWNAGYWHRRAGSVLPEDQTLDEEWDSLLRAYLK